MTERRRNQVVVITGASAGVSLQFWVSRHRATIFSALAAAAIVGWSATRRPGRHRARPRVAVSA